MQVTFAAFVSLFIATVLALESQSDRVDPDTSRDCTYLLEARDSTWSCARFESEGAITHQQFVSWNPSVNNDCSGIKVGNGYCVEVNYGLPADTETTTVKTETEKNDVEVSRTSIDRSQTIPNNGIQTPQPTQPDMVGNCVKFHFISQGNVCSQITSHNGISQSDFAKWNPRVGEQCTGMWANAYACVGVAAFSLKSRFRIDCTGDVYNNVILQGSDGYCMNTDCQVGSLEIDADGLCPDSELQLSYWENKGCSGKWYGYGYADKGTCRKLWTGGRKFKAVHLRCARRQDDCASMGTCTHDPGPEQNVC